MPTTNGVLTNSCEQSLLDHILNNTAWTLPTCYLGLLIATPTDAGGTEVTTAGTNGYARLALGTAGASKFAAASARSTSTNADLTFGPSTGGPWSTVSFWGMFTAATAGTLLAYGDITDGVLGTNDSYKIPSGQLTISFSAGSKWTDAACNLFLDHITGRTSYTSPTSFLALFNGDPIAAGTEVTTAGTNGYARQDLDAALSPASSGTITNGSIITFGPGSTSNWAQADYYAVFDASTAGTKLGGALLTTAKTVNIGDSAEFAASALSFSLD